MKSWPLGFGLLLIGCETAPEPKKPAAPADTQITVQASITSKDNLRVEGTTNLSDGAVLDLMICPANSDRTAGPTYNCRVAVRGGAFSYEIAGASRLPHGAYLVEARFAAAGQSDPRIVKGFQSGQLKEKTVRSICNK